MLRLERTFSRIFGKLFFSQEYLCPELQFLIILFCLIFTCLILLKKKEASPPSSIISILAFLSAIFVAVLVSSPAVVKAMENPPGPGPSEAGPSAERGEPSSAPLPGAAPDYARLLREAQAGRMKRLEADELAQFLSNIQPANIESETRNLEYKILFHQDFIYRCRCFLDGRKLPMLEKQNERLIDLQSEERKLKNLLRSLLETEKLEYNLSSLWLLEKKLHKPEWVKSVLIPFLSEFGKKRGGQIFSWCRYLFANRETEAAASLGCGKEEWECGLLSFDFMLSRLQSDVNPRALKELLNRLQNGRARSQTSRARAARRFLDED